MTPDSPQTEAGKRLLERSAMVPCAVFDAKGDIPGASMRVVPIVSARDAMREAAQEARAAFAARLREAAMKLPLYPDIDSPGTPTISLAAVLQAIEEASK